MKLLNKTSALSFYMIHTGFMAFKSRIKEVLSATSGLNLDDMVDDDTLQAYYREGESPEFVAASLSDWSYQD